MKAFADVLPFPGIAIQAAPPPVRVAPPRPAPPAADEATLCAAALAGSAEAWSALVARHNHRVVVTLLARGVRVDRAKDIAQEAWIRLVEQQRLGKLERLQLPGLAIVQASFLAMEAARREVNVRRHEPLDEPAVAAALADPHDDAETRLMTEERVTRAVE